MSGEHLDVEALIRDLFDPAAPSPRGTLKGRPKETKEFQRALIRELSGMEDPSVGLEPILGGENHLLILELLAREPVDPSVRVAVDYLLLALPGQQIKDLIRMQGVAQEAKVDALERYVLGHTDLPPGCEPLWDEAVQQSDPQAGGEPGLLAQLLGKLDLGLVTDFYHAVAGERSAPFLAALVNSFRQGKSTRFPVTKIVQAMDDRAVVSLNQGLGARFFEHYPTEETALGEKVSGILHTLQDHPDEFSDRLAAVAAAVHLLPDDADRNLLKAWQECATGIAEVGRLQDQRGGFGSRRQEATEKAVRHMTVSLHRALPEDRFPDDATGSRKVQLLADLGRHLLGGRALLPGDQWQNEALWAKVGRYYQEGIWPAVPVQKPAGRRKRKNPKVLIVAGGAAAALLLVAILAAKIVTANRGKTPDGSVVREDGQEDPNPTPEDEGEGPETSTIDLPGTVEPVPPTPELPEQPNPPEPPNEREPPAPATEPAQPDPMPPDKPDGAAPPTVAETVPPAHPPEQPHPGDAEPPSRPPEQMPPPKKTWEELAAEYAERHAGVLLSEKPLFKGEFAIPPAALPPRADAPTPYLGPGSLLFGSETYEFGNGFSEDRHVTHHEIPKLSEDLELPGIEVKLVSRSDGPYLMVSAGNMPSFSDVEKECDEELGPLQEEFNEISSNLRKCERRSAPLEERAESLAALATRFGVELPTFPPKPDLRDPQFHGKPERYKQAVNQWNGTVVELNKQVGRKADEVSKLAKERKTALLKDMDAIKDKYAAEKIERRKQFTAVRTRLEDESKKITAVVYQGADLPAPPTPDSPGPPDKPPTGPAETVRDIAGSLLITGSRVATEGELKQYAAVIEPRVSKVKGALPPPWFKEDVFWQCDVSSLAEGVWSEATRTSDSEGPRTAGVRRGATAVRLRFRFLRNRVLGEPEVIGKTEWSTIREFEEGHYHTITCEITAQGFETLRERVP